MSRIYDVLKRAEADTDVGEEPVEAPVLIAPGPLPPAAEDSLLTLESILANCVPTAWLPDTTSMLFFGAEEKLEGTEQFRTLRAHLYQLKERHSLRKIVVASAIRGEGRSFVAANLAQALARQPGCRALLIDADLHNPSLHGALGTASGPGLSEYLLGESNELAIIQRGQMDNLFFISSGRAVPGQTELLCGGRLKLLLDRYEGAFDWIVLDSPASMPVSDSSLISNACDGVLMVVRANSTPFDIARKAQAKFSAEKLLGVVLNGTPSAGSPRAQQYYANSLPRSVVKEVA